MPDVRMYIAMSLDGYIATSDGGVDWLAAYPAENVGYPEFIGQIDAIIIGRRTYEQVTGFGDRPYAGTRTFVLSSKPIMPAHYDVERAGDLDGLVGELRTSAEGDVWVLGGAETLHRAFAGGHIDRIEVFVIPVLLGSGIPLFSWAAGPRDLELMDATAFPNGVVKLDYRPRASHT